MAKVNLWSSTYTNQVGVAFFWLGCMTNDLVIADPKKLNELEHQLLTKPPVVDFQAFNKLPNTSFSLTSNASAVESLVIEEQTIIEFGTKLLGNSVDIDPDIKQIVEKHFWDMV